MTQQQLMGIMETHKIATREWVLLILVYSHPQIGGKVSINLLFHPFGDHYSVVTSIIILLVVTRVVIIQLQLEGCR